MGEAVSGGTMLERDPQGSPAPEGLVQSASELRAGDYVIYPSQGVHRVIGLERMDIAGQQLEVLKLAREHDDASVIVPVEKVPSTGLRRIAAREVIEDVFHVLGAAGREVELDWKERHRENVERLMTGGVLGVAEVVKELHALSLIRPPPPKERELYDGARHLLVHEVAVSLAVPLALAEDYIDYALTPPAGVKLALKPPPRPKPARWVPPRGERRLPAAELAEQRGGEEIALEVRGPGEDVPPVEEIGEAAEKEQEGKATRRRPRGSKRAARGERATKAQPKQRAPRKGGAKKARPAKRRAGKRRAAKRTSRARR